MFHDIIVPLDGSSLAECAIGPAGSIASACGARLHLVRVHVARDGDSRDQDAIARAGVSGYLQQLRAWLAEAGPCDVRVAVLEGSPALAIADYADCVEADLIVMTSHGRTGAQRRQMGSVASVVAHHVRCPVLLTRGEPGKYVPNRASPERVLIAVDGTERPDEVHAFALQLASLSHPSFRIVFPIVTARVPEYACAGTHDERPECDWQVAASAESYVSGIASRLRCAGLRAEVEVLVTNEPARALLDAAERHDADVVVLI